LHEDTLSVKNFVLPEKIEGNLPASQDPLIKLVEKAMKDPAFKAKLMSNPKATARDMGVSIPDAIDVRVFQNSADTVHLILPANPKDAELSDADLEAVAGGMSKSGQTITGCSAGAVGLGTAAAVSFAAGFTLVGVITASALGGAAAATAGASAVS